MATLEGKDRIKRDYLYRLWSLNDEARDLVRAASPLRRKREQLRSQQVVACQLASQCPGELTLEQLHLVTDTLETAHVALVEALALVVIWGLVEPNIRFSFRFAYVPTVIVQMRVPIEITKTTLLKMAKEGKIELRSDGDTLRYPRSELSMAPKAQDGSMLLWVRLLKRVSGL